MRLPEIDFDDRPPATDDDDPRHFVRQDIDEDREKRAERRRQEQG